MKNDITIESIKSVNPILYGIINDYNKEIISTIKMINSFLDSNFKINESPYFLIKKDEGLCAYLEDGNTQTEGAEWSVYWAFPLNGKAKENFNYSSIVRSYASESIIFTLTNITERYTDLSISGCKFFSLYFSYGDYVNIANNVDRATTQQHMRLDHINNNYNPMHLFKVENYAKIILNIRKLKEIVTITNELNKYYGNK